MGGGRQIPKLWSEAESHEGEVGRMRGLNYQNFQHNSKRVGSLVLPYRIHASNYICWQVVIERGLRHHGCLIKHIKANTFLKIHLSGLHHQHTFNTFKQIYLSQLYHEGWLSNQYISENTFKQIFFRGCIWRVGCWAKCSFKTCELAPADWSCCCWQKHRLSWRDQ